ncbi:bifunctional hydroxymethylpyrimidine kinase/phosphomethylpyrimidine kinase [Aciduricibacillus chroicocephali]|uniref:Hydroxymethylpyrimidine/phosphomethylpyrimidine kinase n=1 Tax=Aciduricibacillus chroicocephali TaxID=3054939 RepID=A0ABY9L1B1_9BACI|nr:bifunctional hydroxymethylpyrimidine kinase/phosphomethylpyrimidine kinase [Bacillaceae bacterium 44XB]
MKNVNCTLTIAGTDPTGGAGIQADLKTFQELRTYGMTVITSVLAQNTTGVQKVLHQPIDLIESQINSVISDIPVDAFKTGMIANLEMMELLERKIPEIGVPYVMDPVMVATSGDSLIHEDARTFLRDRLMPFAKIVTPNIPEAESLIGVEIKTLDDMKDAAAAIVSRYGAQSALVKGGHLNDQAADVLFDGKTMHTFTSERINTKNTHGTGCTLSAAITAYLAKGLSLYEAVELSKKYITEAIRYSFNIGKGNGPTNHWAPRIEG